ncbi:MAG TPA: hypothetical protein VLV49_15435 [Terriglobales bacterium]|nr:hypothetical protein [Terriglobales bacterium]
MERLPKIVRDRLVAEARPEVHPDPDVLTAFSENSLRESERDDVLGHLAHCQECREALALAAPQMEMEPVAVAAVAATAAPLRKQTRWLDAPMLRWGAVAAGVVVVGAAVLAYRGSGNHSETSATANKTAAPVSVQFAPGGDKGADQLAKVITPAAPQAAPQVTRSRPTRDLRASAATKSVSDEDRLMAKKTPAENETVAGGAFAGHFGDGAFSRSPSATGNAPAASPEERDKTAALPAPKKELAPAAPPPPQNEVATTAPSPAPQTAEVLDSSAKAESLQKAKAAPQAQVSMGAFSGGNKLDLMRQASSAITPRWVLSGDGAMLLRSTDNGKTWQNVPVASHVVLLAVDAYRSQVWAGGGGGALYHSADAGEHWVQVKPVADGKALTDDVTAIHFADLQHGSLTTLHHETWTTSDGGQSWQVR